MSPCKLIILSNSLILSLFFIASNILSVPEGRLGSVRIALPPKDIIHSKTSFSEQATMTSPRLDAIACSQTLCIIGFPQISAIGLLGNLTEAILAGIKISVFINFVQKLGKNF